MPLNFKLADRIQERIEQKKELETKIRERREEIEKKEKEIIGKDIRLFQLEKLFQGTAKIFSKQHNYVDQLKQQLEQEIKEKGISEEKIEHLENDVRIYTDWKNELAKKLTELEEASKENEKERDKELQDLKAKNNNLTKLVKELTEVKMAREKSEERLRKQSEEFLKVQEMNQVVYDILGAESDKKGLLLRSQEVVEKLKTHKEQEKNLKNELEKTKADLQKELSWWDKWINERNDISLQFGDYYSFKTDFLEKISIGSLEPAFSHRYHSSTAWKMWMDEKIVRINISNDNKNVWIIKSIYEYYKNNLNYLSR